MENEQSADSIFLSYFVATHLHVDELKVVGVFTTADRAIKACEDYHAGNYDGGELTKFNWLFDYVDENEVYKVSASDPDFEEHYLIKWCALDETIDDGSKAFKLEYKEQT